MDLIGHLAERDELITKDMVEMSTANAASAAISVPAKAVRLTKREIEVLSLIAQGHSSKEAADALFVSKRTVDFHLANIYDKLQVNNRVQAFRAATRLGLIPFEPTFMHTRGEA